MKRTVRIIAFFVACVLLWEALARSGLWSPVLLPPPSKVGAYLATNVPDLLHGIVNTMRRLGIGYLVGIVVGLPLGLLTARFRFLADTLGVAALGLQTLPSVCWVPLALLWFSQSEGAILFVVVMGTLWSVLIATDNGVRNVPPIYARAARTMGSRNLDTWIFVIVPASLPFIVSGMKQGWAFAWRSLMAAELYVAMIRSVGLGHLLHFGRELNAMDQVLGVMLVIILIGLLADKVLFAPWERFMHARWGTGGSEGELD